ncbi:ABC transporter substrate-binding protein [Peterkaempfera griseoplana]|uniref:ABC transporter substrate-binding protein n=1 Tax=Peterkaempfera griseoplana TaxID=66896 RepID=UPI000B098335|nr:ABC transporter substrate-binding protein [Peterkaempfera griseoplana]
MTARSLRHRLFATGAVLVAGSLSLTACGSSGSSASSAPNPTVSVNAATADSSLTALVPADVKSKGKLVVGADASYAPNEFKDDKGNVVGMDVDLADAIAAKLGLKAEVQNSKFTAIIPGIAAKKFDLGMSSFTDSKEREQQVDMITYFSAGTSVAVKAGNPDKISADDLCGKKVAVQTGTVQSDEVKDKRNPDCKKAGKPTIPNDGDKYDLQTDVNNALVSGRDQVMMADSPVVDYAIKQSAGQLEKIGETYDSAPYGIVVSKGSPLAKAIQGALTALISDGTYKQILQKWGVESGAIDKSVINGATS